MWALTFHAPEDVRHERVADPAVEAPGDALVGVEVAGLCGSDLHPYHGRETGLDVGCVLGHELVGRILEVGSAVERFAPGDRVVSPFTTCCGRCFYCRCGLTCRCPEGQLLGWVEGGVGLHGAQAERVRVPLADATLVPLPPAMESPELALLAADVLPTGLYGADLLGLEPGPGGAPPVAAVVGCGPVGLAAVAALGERGAETVLAVDAVAPRRRLAGRLGARSVDPEREAPGEVARSLTEGRGVDGVVEAVGSPEATRLALEMLRPGGTLAAVGVHTEPAFPFPPGEAYDRNLTLRAGRCPARRYAGEALDILAAGRYPLDELFTHRVPLSEGPAAYRLFAARRDGVVKVVLDPER